MWEKDSLIDELNLDVTSIDSAKLHSKYLSILSIAKLTLKKKQTEFEVLRKEKWEWFAGRMTRQQVEARGWKHDPFDGASKPKLKDNMEMFYKADPDLSKLNSQIEYQKVIIDALVDIMENVKWRHQNIRNIIAWRQFVAGD